MQASTSVAELAGGALGSPASGERPSAGGTAGLKRAHYRNSRLPFFLLLPQLLVLLLFFFIPAVRALVQAFVLTDPFGTTVHFVWFDNFRALFASPEYRSSVWVTLWFTLAQNVLTLSVAAVLAFATDRVIRARGLYRSIVLLPYAIAPVIAGILWAFLFNAHVGPADLRAEGAGRRLGSHAQRLRRLPAGDLRRRLEAHLLRLHLPGGGACSPCRRRCSKPPPSTAPARCLRFFKIALPMIGPTVFFLLVMNFVYGFFETFAIVDAVTKGGPGGATMILVYKVYQDGFVHIDLGSSAAQSVLLMIFAVVLTLLQFRYVERNVNYDV